MIKIPLFKVRMSPDVIDKLPDILYSGYVGQGKEVDLFEQELEEYIGAPSCLTLNSATSGLHLALRMIGVRGKEVISTPLTFPATTTSLVLNGAKIVWADVDPLTGNIDPKDVARKITKNTAAIMCVHWGGIPCEVDKLNALGVPVIEDASQAFGATYFNRKVGTFSDYTIFSFQAIKNVTTIDGGCLFVKDRDQYERGKKLRWYGVDRILMKETRDEGNITEAGDKLHMNNVNACIGRCNLVDCDKYLEIARDNAAFYTSMIPSHIVLPNPPTSSEPTWFHYQILVNSRNKFVKHMMEKGIGVDIVDSRNDIHDFVKEFRRELPNLDLIDDMRICIPVGHWVTLEDRQYIVDCIKEGW
jgi:perosamine synthetase